MEEQMHHFYYVGQIFRIEYLLWDEKSKKLSIDNTNFAKFSVALHIFLASLWNLSDSIHQHCFGLYFLSHPENFILFLRNIISIASSIFFNFILVTAATCDTVYNYENQQRGIILNFLQYATISSSFFTVLILIMYYYVTQEEQISWHKSINEVDELLQLHEIDVSKLCPGAWIKFIKIPSLVAAVFTSIAFTCLHILRKEKYLTIQLLPGAFACYRGNIGMYKLLAIKDRYFVLNRIMKKLVERKHNIECTVCTHLRLKSKLHPGKMCCKHTILYAILVYEKLGITCEKWKKLYMLFVRLEIIYLFSFSPISFVYWIELIWFNESVTNLPKLYIYVVICFIEIGLSAAYNFFCDSTSFEAAKTVRWFHRVYLHYLNRKCIKNAVCTFSVKISNSPLQFSIFGIYDMCNRATFLSIFSSAWVLASYLWPSDSNLKSNF